MISEKVFVQKGFYECGHCNKTLKSSYRKYHSKTCNYNVFKDVAISNSLKKSHAESNKKYLKNIMNNKICVVCAKNDIFIKNGKELKKCENCLKKDREAYHNRKINLEKSV